MRIGCKPGPSTGSLYTSEMAALTDAIWVSPPITETRCAFSCRGGSGRSSPIKRSSGVLLFVIPQLRLANCARLLSEQFADLRVFRLTEPACLQYKQIVVVATRRKRHARLSDAALLDGVRY